MSCSCKKCEPEKCLLQAECDQEIIARYSALYDAGKLDEAAKVLKCQRCNVIEEIHRLQKQVDLLDYIVHNLKKEKDEQK